MQSGVQFDEDNIGGSSAQRLSLENARLSPVAKFLMKTNIIRSERQAVIVAIIIAALLLLAACIMVQHALAEPTIIELKVK